MKYELINEHANINFHDAYVKKVYLNGSDMVWELIALQTTGIDFTDKREDDYYIKNAVMVLENAVIEKIFIGGCCHYENGVQIIDVENKTVPPDEYGVALETVSYKHGSYIYGIKSLSPSVGGHYRINVMAGPEIMISFEKSVISWDEFAGTEWCENKWQDIINDN